MGRCFKVISFLNHFSYGFVFDENYAVPDRSNWLHTALILFFFVSCLRIPNVSQTNHRKSTISHMMKPVLFSILLIVRRPI